MVASFAGERFRVGAFATGWLFATAVMIGLGLGPVIKYFASVEPESLTSAFAATALVVAGTAEQAVMLATGIFVSVINIFLLLLNVFSR